MLVCMTRTAVIRENRQGRRVYHRPCPGRSGTGKDPLAQCREGR